MVQAKSRNLLDRHPEQKEKWIHMCKQNFNCADVLHSLGRPKANLSILPTRIGNRGVAKPVWLQLSSPERLSSYYQEFIKLSLFYHNTSTSPLKIYGLF